MHPIARSSATVLFWSSTDVVVRSKYPVLADLRVRTRLELVASVGTSSTPTPSASRMCQRSACASTARVRLAPCRRTRARGAAPSSCSPRRHHRGDRAIRADGRREHSEPRTRNSARPRRPRLLQPSEPHRIPIADFNLAAHRARASNHHVVMCSRASPAGGLPRRSPCWIPGSTIVGRRRGARPFAALWWCAAQHPDELSDRSHRELDTEPFAGAREQLRGGNDEERCVGKDRRRDRLSG